MEDQDTVIIDIPLEELIKEFPNPEEDQKLLEEQKKEREKALVNERRNYSDDSFLHSTLLIPQLREFHYFQQQCTTKEDSNEQSRKHQEVKRNEKADKNKLARDIEAILQQLLTLAKPTHTA